jgi:hypothetical protein
VSTVLGLEPTKVGKVEVGGGRWEVGGAKVRMCKGANVRMCKGANVQRCECAKVEVRGGGGECGEGGRWEVGAPQPNVGHER